MSEPIRVMYMDRESQKKMGKRGNLVEVSNGFVVLDNCTEERGRKLWIPIDCIIIMNSITLEELSKPIQVQR